MRKKYKQFYLSPKCPLEFSVNWCGFLGALSICKNAITCKRWTNNKLLTFSFKRNKMNY